MRKPIKGFSKLSKEAKVEWLSDQFFDKPEDAVRLLKDYWHAEPMVQKLHDEFIENTLSNYFMPFGVAPNFLIDGKLLTIPMAIEESSVVAAAAKSATYWMARGGFKTSIVATKKVGHIHFMYQGDASKLQAFFEELKPHLLKETEELTANMRARGGGVTDMKLIDKRNAMDDYWQIEGLFETCDSMGANFINSCLEQFSQTFQAKIALDARFTEIEKDIQVVMCILSNYTPQCVVRAEVSCKVEDLDGDVGISPQEFAQKFQRAVRIAEIEPYRASTHNKGIMNGVDAVIIATGNDFRAVEAACHTYAAKDGQYSSLSHCSVENGIFRFWIELPLALGTVGGLTRLHPLVKFSLELLQNPNSMELMSIVASSGLAQNFAALRALTTTGIQKGHMKMHLLNILNQLEATSEEKSTIVNYFKDKVVSHSAAVNKFCELRGVKSPAEIKKAP